MAYGSTASSNPPSYASSYRVKFKREEFINLVKFSKPELIFHVKRMYFFAFQGFVVYSLECDESDFIDQHITILESIEFSNRPWNEG